MAKGTELKVQVRDVLGKKVGQLRRQGFIPANIYGHNVQSLAVQVDLDELKRVLRTAGRNDLVHLEVDGQEPRPAFIRDVQHNPVTDAVLHVDFLQISLKEKVRMDVPVHLVGTAPAVSAYGGVLMHGVDHVTVEALPTDVPSFVEADVSRLTSMEHALHVSDLKVPAGVAVLTDPELVVAKVAHSALERAVAAEEAAAGEVVTAEAEPAPTQE